MRQGACAPYTFHNSWYIVAEAADGATVKSFFEDVIAQNQHATVRGYAMFGPAKLLMCDKENASEEDVARAEKLTAEAEPLLAGTIVGRMIQAPNFE